MSEDGWAPGAPGLPDQPQSSAASAPALTERLIQAAVDYEQGRCSSRELAEARAAVEAAIPADAQPSPDSIGVAVPMPGASAFTMCCFMAENVPVGTKLYTSQPSPAATVETDDPGLIGHTCSSQHIMREVPDPNCPACNDPLHDLVSRFARALLAKLKLAQANGKSGWEMDDWEEQCQRGLLHHIEKGDPRDVAAYCAFMWHHGWITRTVTPAAAHDVPRGIKSSILMTRAQEVRKFSGYLAEVLEFLNSIEGAGYGGMASFEVARMHIVTALALSRPEPK